MKKRVGYTILLATVLISCIANQREGVQPASAAYGDTGITGEVWQWVQTLYSNDKRSIPAKPENYTIRFLKDGTVVVKADCNLKGGTYSTDGKRLSIEITHSTMAACEEGSQEKQFVRDLRASSIFFFKNGDLYIDLKYDTGTMKLTRTER